MDVIRSQQFLIALVCFLTPMAMAAGVVYRQLCRSDLRRRRKRVEVSVASVRRMLEQVEPRAAAATQQTAPVTLQSLQQPLENLRRCLVEFRTSIQHSRSALGELQECDSRFSLDLGRASAAMQHAFTK